VQTTTPAPTSLKAFQALPAASMSDNLRLVFPILSGVIEGLLITVLLFFLLYSKRDLRDRFVRLAARARITVAPQAMETAVHAVGRYLLLFSLTNLGFGVACGLVTWFLGLQNALLWGLLAFLLRFIHLRRRDDVGNVACTCGLCGLSGVVQIPRGNRLIHVL